jgi:prepilin-type N-terminal cleavage/methylation domain-containing protein/prepilin-type processing-associated H-X9-DG protein
VCKKAFTLVELLIVIAVIAILAAILLPTLERAKGRGQRIACANNLKQLQAGWHLYVGDNHGKMPVNDWDGIAGDFAASPPGSWVVGNAGETSWTNIVRGTQWPYNPSLGVYHCPADRSVARDGATVRFRSYSLGSYLGSTPYGDYVAWQVSRVSQLRRTATILGFACEDDGSIEDGSFAIYPYASTLWNSLPSSARHNQGCCFSFVDGHAEYWKWKCGTFKFAGRPQPAKSAELLDLQRMQTIIPDPEESDHRGHSTNSVAGGRSLAL